MEPKQLAMETYLIYALLFIICYFFIKYYLRFRKIKNIKIKLLKEFDRISNCNIINSFAVEDMSCLLPDREYVPLSEIFNYKKTKRRLYYLTSYSTNLVNIAKEVATFSKENYMTKMKVLSTRLNEVSTPPFTKLSNRQLKIKNEARLMLEKINVNIKSSNLSLLLNIYTEGMCKLARAKNIKAFE